MVDDVFEQALARLLRAVGPSGCHVELEGGILHLVGSDRKNALAVDPGLLAEAVRRGLLCRKAGRILLLPSARSFLKRTGLAEDRRYVEQHGKVDGLKTVEGALLRIDRDESPLASLARLKDRSGSPWFDASLLSAGQRLAEDFTRAGLQPKITMGWTPRVDQARGRDPSRDGLSQLALDARKRFAQAARAMGPDLADVVIDVCCFEKGLERIEQERGWPIRSAKLMLRAGLLALERHYNPSSSRRAGRMETWQSWANAGGDSDQPGR